MSDLEAIRAWYFDKNPDMVISELRGRLSQLHDDYWEIRRENIELHHENLMLRQGHIPDSAAWVLMKVAAQRKEIRRLRKKLGYQDE